MKTERNSSFELLRILCIFGITVMHSFAKIDTASSVLNTEVHILFNSLFNTAVTCFILISGYFGIKFNLKKLIRMDFMVIFFTLMGTIVLGDFGIKELIKSCIPVISRRYWFISCYFVLCILAPFLNQIADYLERKAFRKLLLVMLFVFSFIPTFFTYDIMQDAGKGLVHFVMIYLLGRYLALYKNASFCQKNLLLGFFTCVLIIFAADSLRSFSSGVIYSTFARDCSLFIILAATLLFLFFQGLSFSSRFINRAASNVLAVTVLDSFLQQLFARYFDLNAYNDSAFLFFIVLIYAFAIVVVAAFLNEIRKFTIGRIEPWLCDTLSILWNKLQDLLLKLMDKILSLFIRPV